MVVFARGRYWAGLTFRDQQLALMRSLQLAELPGRLLQRQVLCQPRILTCHQAAMIALMWRLTWLVHQAANLIPLVVHDLPCDIPSAASLRDHPPSPQLGLRLSGAIHEEAHPR